MKTFVTAAAIGAGLLTGGMAQAQQMPPADMAVADAPRPAPPPPPRHGGPLNMFQRADVDHNGIITRDEAEADARRRFVERDVNHDGRLTRDERRPARRDRRADGGPLPPPLPGAGGAPSSNVRMPPPPLAGDHEAGGDHGHRRERQTTEKQFRERALAFFDRIDIDHDGRVDAREIEAARLVQRARRVGENGDPASMPRRTR